MDKGNVDSIVSALQFLVIFLTSLFALFKGVISWRKESTKQREIEEEGLTKRAEVEATEITKRAEIDAKEKSIGMTALALLRQEISELKEITKNSDIKFEKIDNAIKQLEIMYTFIEKKMLSTFPENKK